MESSTGSTRFEMEKPMEDNCRRRRYSFRAKTIYDSKASKNLQLQRMKSMKLEEDENDSMEFKEAEIQPGQCPLSPQNPLEDSESRAGNSSKSWIILDKIMDSNTVEDAYDAPSTPENADVPLGPSSLPEIGEPDIIMKTPTRNEPIITTVAQTISDNDDRIRKRQHSGKAFRSVTKGPLHLVPKKRSKIMCPTPPSNHQSAGTEFMNTDEEDVEFSRFAYKSTTVFEHSVIIEYDMKREYD